MTEAALHFVPPRVPFTDPETGVLTRAGNLFLQGIYARVGGATGPSTTDLSASLFEDAGSSETNALLFSAEQAAGQWPPGAQSALFEQLPTDPPNEPIPNVDQLQAELAAMRDQIAEIVKDLDAIRQGQGQQP